MQQNEVPDVGYIVYVYYGITNHRIDEQEHYTSTISELMSRGAGFLDKSIFRCYAFVKYH